MMIVAAIAGCERRVTAVRWGGVGSEVGHAKGEQAEQLWGGYGSGIKGPPRRVGRDAQDDNRRTRKTSQGADATDPAAVEAMKRKAAQRAEQQ